jgi:hypothetical protein
MEYPCTITDYELFGAIVCHLELFGLQFGSLFALFIASWMCSVHSFPFECLFVVFDFLMGAKKGPSDRHGRFVAHS